MSEHAPTADEASSFKRVVAKVGLRLPPPDGRFPADFLERRYDAARLPPDDRVELTEQLARRHFVSSRWMHNGYRMVQRR